MAKTTIKKTDEQAENDTSDNDLKKKRGYLNDDFMFFHLCDTGNREYEYHYHDFDKIYIPIRGEVTYRIEGRSYRLRPYDVVLVRAGLMHRPEVAGMGTYERMIIYINPQFLQSCSETDMLSLERCFDKAAEDDSYVFRIPAAIKSRLWQSIHNFEIAEKECGTEKFASEMYDRVRFIEMMIELNRSVLNGEAEYVSAEDGGRVSEILDYINAHLTEKLDVEKLASHFFMNRYYLMHVFRNETGGTLGNYISSKRLLMARNMIRSGTAATQACFECGFGNYSAFYRAYRKVYGASPGAAMQDKDDMLKE